jgi:hypothetical protein
LALIFFSGGESGTPDFTTMSGNISCSSAHVKTGNYSLYLQSTNSAITQVFPYGLTNFYMTFWMYPYFGSGSVPSWYFRNGSNTVIVWTGGVYASLLPYTFYVGGTAIGSTITSFYSNAWFLIEIHIILHASSGLIHVRVNGIDDLIYTGNTIAAGYSTTTNFYMYTGYSDTWVDDFIINDTAGSINNSWMGGSKIVALSPVGPGSSSQWTPSAGLNWQCVDEIPISATDYVTGNIAGMLDLYDLAGLPAGVCSDVSLLGVKVFNSVARSGITVSYIKNSLRTNSSNVFSPNVTVPPDALIQSTFWDLNPVTGTTWTYTDINTLETGVKVA